MRALRFRAVSAESPLSRVHLSSGIAPWPVRRLMALALFLTAPVSVLGQLSGTNALAHPAWASGYAVPNASAISRPGFEANQVQSALPQSVLRQRQQIVLAILTTDSPDLVARQRWLCINGQEPARVKEARKGGMDFTPDAVDSCIAALQRSAKESLLIGAYRKLEQNLGGDTGDYQTLPKAIGASVLNGDGKLSIGNGKAATVTPELALDAGFTVAYTEGAAPKQEIDPEKLKALAEACLSTQKDAGTCFSVGYIFGAQAVSAR